MNENCPHLQNGNCAAAAQIIQLYTGATAEIKPSPETCARCVSVGGGVDGAPLLNQETAALACRFAPPDKKKALELDLLRRLPRRKSEPKPKPQPKSKGDIGEGVGTVLEQILKEKEGAVAVKGCSCRAVMKRMNEQGPDWCVENVDWIVGEMQKNGAKSKNRKHRWAAKWAGPVFRRKAKAYVMEAVAIHRGESALPPVVNGP